MSETLYNGLVIPYAGGDGNWPPQDRPINNSTIVVPPYTTNSALIPNPIPIDTGRQLFHDNFLVQSTTCGRTFYTATPLTGTVLLEKDAPGGYAIPYGDGLWYDPNEADASKKYKLYYGNAFDGPGQMSLATAPDPEGTWTKRGIVWTATRFQRHGNTVWLDLDEANPAKRWKMVAAETDTNDWSMALYYSADGISWGSRVAESVGLGAAETTSITYYRFRRKWVMCIRSVGSVVGRFQRYYEADTLELLLAIPGQTNAVPWLLSDTNDPPLVPSDIDNPQVYRQSAVAYESVFVHTISIMECTQNFRFPNGVLVEIGLSRDGFYPNRSSRARFMDYAPVANLGDWNGGDVNCASGCPLVKGDRLYFAARTDRFVSPNIFPSTSMWWLRRDGFASLDFVTNDVLVTRPMQWTDRSYLFLNADASKGNLKIELLDAAGSVLPLKFYDLKGNYTAYRAHRLRSPGAVHDFSGHPVKVRLTGSNAHLYALWFSTDVNGASGGYINGPG